MSVLLRASGQGLETISVATLGGGVGGHLVAETRGAAHPPAAHRQPQTSPAPG